MDNNTLTFRVSAALKNIVGRDLIVDDYIAVFELVKNAYDAYANEVRIIFENNKITIIDNGKGMSLQDLLDRWLFLAYSAKRGGTEDKDLSTIEMVDYRDKIKQHRFHAGAKGIGRFSCDRLGNILKLATKKAGKNSRIEQLIVDWKDFERSQDDEFININIKHQRPTSLDFKNFSHGTILEITDLTSAWPRKKILNLKHSLEKLINPVEPIRKCEAKTPLFTIVIESEKDLPRDKDEKLERDKVNGPVKNFIFETLNVKTTQIEVIINEKGRFISTELVDRGTPIYKIRETNNTFPRLKNIKIRLFYLNQAAKINFINRMGVSVKSFGSVFLYKNGFRVYPYGKSGNDSLGLDARKQQGYRRYLGTRDLLGRIEIIDDELNFKEKSSRDGGLIENEYYDELIKVFWACIKKFENYIVDIRWALKDHRDLDNKSNDVSAIDNEETKALILDMISKLTGTNNVELLEYNKDFLNIIQEKLEDTKPEAFEKLIDIAKKANDDSFQSEILNAEKAYIRLAKERDDVESWARKAEEERRRTEEQLEIEKNKNIFLSATSRGLSKDAQGLIHNIKLVSSNINAQVEILMRRISGGEINKADTLNRLSKIKLNSDKCLKISELITRSNFKEQSEKQKVDIVRYVEQYLDTYSYINEKNDIEFDIISDNTSYWSKISILELSIVLDNLISNSTKAGASKVLVEMKRNKTECQIIFSDNGSGVAAKFLENPEQIFELGVTDTRGSGIGLYTAREALNTMNGKISFLGNSISLKGASFQIAFG